jgi:uncharacterized Zn finger protein
MPDTNPDALRAAIRQRWPDQPSDKARRYVGSFFETARIGPKIIAKVRGNHGTYTVSILLNQQTINAACSCYIGKGGYCHHCEALAITFLNDAERFKAVEPPRKADIQNLAQLEAYLKETTLEDLVRQLKANGISQKAFAESIGMSTRHLSAVKSSELRNHYFHELGATKLACLWVLSHIVQAKKE